MKRKLRQIINVYWPLDWRTGAPYPVTHPAAYKPAIDESAKKAMEDPDLRNLGERQVRERMVK